MAHSVTQVMLFLLYNDNMPQKSRVKTTAQKPQQVAGVDSLHAMLRRAHQSEVLRFIGYFLVAFIWAYFAASSYSALMTPVDPGMYGSEPHPIVGGVYEYSYVQSLGSVLLSVALGILSATVIVAFHSRRWRKPLLCLQLVAALGLFVLASATMAWSQASIPNTPTLRPLDDVIVLRMQCGDAVRTVDDYTFGAHTFYALKDQGYVLAATYDTQRGMLDSDAACAMYYSLRAQYTADAIVLQIFTYDEHNVSAPYLYKYAGQKNVAYGIFVRK